MTRYISYSLGLKLGSMWIPLWGKRFGREQLAGFSEKPSGFHRVSYLRGLN